MRLCGVKPSALYRRRIGRPIVDPGREPMNSENKGMGRIHGLYGFYHLCGFG